METLQEKAKAVVALVLSGAAQLVAFYQANQNLTLKDVVMSVVGALITATAVHQVSNKKA